MKMVRSYAIGKLNGNLLGGKKKGPAKAGSFAVNDTFVSFSDEKSFLI
jgi:hypothetical protein